MIGAEIDRKHARVAIIGTGFSGLGMAIGLKRRGVDDFVVLERAEDVGGTWRDNTYPGCQCDVPSHLYSFSFAPNPGWSRTYSTQPEIWDYLRRVARTTGVTEHVRFGHNVESAAWDEAAARWSVETSKGSWTADVLVSAPGGLAEPSLPDIAGLDRFEGVYFHSGAWNHEHDLTGRRVAVVGTGASAIQIVPHIQPNVERLYVFQRTPAWVLPHTDRRITAAERRLFRRIPPLQRCMRAGIYLAREALVLGMAKNPRLTRPLRALAVRHLRRQIEDPDLRLRLTPNYAPGCKRLLLSNDFYPALTAENVDLVTDPIAEIASSSIVTGDGREHCVDTIVFATGFHVTDNPIAEAVKGRDGRSLADSWRETGLRAYLGTTVEGFPNLFLMTGPNTGIGHTSLLVMIESQIEYVLDCLRIMDGDGITAVEVRPEAVTRFNHELQRKMKHTVWTVGGCASWYLDEQGRNTTLWPDFTWRYRRLTKNFDASDYLLRSDP